MNLSEALSVFNMKSIHELDEDTLKKRYRKLMKIYHPDSNTGNSDISIKVNSAYSILKEEIKLDKVYNEIYASEVDESAIIIGVEDYSDLMKGLDVRKVNGNTVVNKDTILWRNVKYLIRYTLVIDGEEINRIAIVNRNSENIYNARCEIYLKDNEDTKTFELLIYDKKYTVLLDSNKIYLIDVGNGIKIKLSFERKRFID